MDWVRAPVLERETKMRVSVVANCQGRPVASLMKAACPEIDDVPTIVVHLASPASSEEDDAILDRSDIIFAQFVTDTYAAAHLSTSRLKDKYGTRVVSWPNIFFRGQTPDLAYLTVLRKNQTTRERITGPLREYHHRGIVEAWQKGLSAEEALNYLNEKTHEHDRKFRFIADASIIELNKREAALDTSISDIIAAEWRRRRLFFTFNHPSAYLLALMTKRLLSHAGLKTDGVVESANEPLGQVVPPIFDRDLGILGEGLKDSGPSRGAAISIDKGKVEVGAARLYSNAELISESFRAYDAQLERGDSLAFSPP